MEKIIGLKLNNMLDKDDNEELSIIFNEISILKDKKVNIDEKTISDMVLNGVMHKMYKCHQNILYSDNIASYVITKMFFSDDSIIWLDEIYSNYFEYICKVLSHKCSEIESCAAAWSKKQQINIENSSEWLEILKEKFNLKLNNNDMIYISDKLDFNEIEIDQVNYPLSKLAHLWMLLSLIDKKNNKKDENYDEEKLW